MTAWVHILIYLIGEGYPICQVRWWWLLGRNSPGKSYKEACHCGKRGEFYNLTCLVNWPGIRNYDTDMLWGHALMKILSLFFIFIWYHWWGIWWEFDWNTALGSLSHWLLFLLWNLKKKAIFWLIVNACLSMKQPAAKMEKVTGALLLYHID